MQCRSLRLLFGIVPVEELLGYEQIHNEFNTSINFTSHRCAAMVSAKSVCSLASCAAFFKDTIPSFSKSTSSFSLE